MADNNFKVFDESKTNIMSDTDYENHTQRKKGVQSGIASSALHNKLYRQVSMMSKALADFIVSQAFDAKDEDSQLLSQNLQKALTKFAKTPLDDHNTNPAAHAAGIAGNAATATADQQGVKFTQGYVGGRTYLNASMFHAWDEIMTAGVYTIDESCFDLQGAPSGMVTSGVLVVFLMQDTVAQLYIANMYNSVTNNTALKSMATRLYINNAWTRWRYAADYSGIARKFLMLSGGTLTGNLTVPTVHGALDGNADSATRLQTARQIGGVSFDGTADIDLPGVNKIGNQDTTGTADSANYIVYTKGISGDEDNNIALEALQLNRMTLTRAQGVNISGSQRFGSIISLPYGIDDTRNMVQQIFTENDNGRMWFRTNHYPGNKQFTPWSAIAFLSDITAIDSMNVNNANAWWVKLKGGLIIQGGRANSNTFFAYPIAFNNLLYVGKQVTENNSENNMWIKENAVGEWNQPEHSYTNKTGIWLPKMNWNPLCQVLAIGF